MSDLLSKHTKLKLALLLIFLALVEAILKLIFKEFPLVELFGFQGLVGGWYMQKRKETDKAAMEAGQ